MTDSILARVMLAFEGDVLPEAVAARLARAPAAGVTLFRHGNVRSPGQVRALSDAVQRAAGEWPGPLLIAADQEGGQFIALGDESTQFAGQHGAGRGRRRRVDGASRAGDRHRGAGDGRERHLRAGARHGVEPANPALGIRAFGDDPALVARHGAAMVRGLQSAGVAAAVKHFPGAGEATGDPHHGVATVPASRAILDAREFVPFREAFAAGARLAMSAHVTLPAVPAARICPRPCRGTS